MFVHRVSSTRVAYLVSFPSQRRTLPWCLQRQYHVVAARDNLGGGSGLVSCHPYSLEDKRYRLQQYQRQSKARMASNPFSNVSSWVRDVVQSKSLQPPNPILKYTKSVRSSMANDDPTGHPPLPRFSYMLPYHLESAAQEVIRQYHEEMAQLEVSLTATSAAIPEPYPNRTKEEIVRILQKLDRLEAPIQQVLQIGHMLSQLTDDHEDLRAWERALHKVQEMMLNDVEFRSSYIVYNSLEKSMDSTILPPRLLHSFCVGGAQYHDLTDIEDGRATTSSKTINEAREELREIQYHILQIRHRLLSVSPNFMELPKPNQLQTLSDLYQIIGLTWQQARLLGYQTVCQMEMGSTSAVSKSRSHMVTSVEQIRDLHQQVMEIIRPYVKEEVAQLDQAILQEVLGGSAGGGDSKMAERRRQHQEKEQRRLLWHARHAMKQYLTLDGVLEGLFDWTQTLLGISVEEVVDDSGKSGVRGVAVDDIFGWHQNVRLFEVYYDASVAGNISGDDENENSKLLLGRFYLDPYERSAKPRTPNTWLFSQRFSQSMVPVVVMSLCMDSPAWKDDPTLLTWDMVRSLLHQYGKALQLILSASAASPYQSISLDAIRYAPVDVSEFLPYFMEMWLQNDGFVQRLAQLSQDEYDSIPVDLLELLRKDWASQKLDDWRHQIFLGELEVAIWNEVDPLEKKEEDGGENSSKKSLAALQQELAEIYTPSKVPSSQDLSPILEIFQRSSNTADRTVDQEPHMSSHASLLSEMLSANVYVAFQDALTVKAAGDNKEEGKGGANTKEQVQRLGAGVRELFLPSSSTQGTLSLADFEALCGKTISPLALAEVYQLSNLDDE